MMIGFGVENNWWDPGQEPPAARQVKCPKIYREMFLILAAFFTNIVRIKQDECIDLIC